MILKYLLLAVLVTSPQTSEATTQIENIEGKKYILTRTNDVILFNEYEFLFHVTNLTKNIPAI